MSFEVFQKSINDIIHKAGGGISADFRTEDGKHTARLSDGTTITGNLSSLKVSVKWGSGHQAMATL